MLYTLLLGHFPFKNSNGFLTEKTIKNFSINWDKVPGQRLSLYAKDLISRMLTHDHLKRPTAL